ncbi:hypothetical protein EOD04_00305 [Mesorhizobium sp. M2C.T.Ca.TU.009.01.2.1]|nr:hypothetical protein EOD07_20845 [Mesorhizobium sp. M2C.T.Ca.TU.002.02.1.1]RUU72028.1 hypothetical protein EOD04_00305 [Mesorhizobium sp. M2C.T.Ca.TU.009.01.2.1]
MPFALWAATPGSPGGFEGTSGKATSWRDAFSIRIRSCCSSDSRAIVDFGGSCRRLPSGPHAVNLSRSVFADYIVCLEDRRKFKSPKRHLAEGQKMPGRNRARGLS